MAQKNVLKYIVLGLLSHGDLTGYDIKKLFEGEVGDFWHSNHSQIYPELKKMEEAGLIASYEGTVGEKMTKTYYRMEPSGKEELSAWLSEPLGQLPPTRDEFSMKLYLIKEKEHPLVPKLFAQEIERHEEKLAYLQGRWQALFAEGQARKKAYGHALILRQAIEREKHRLAWLREEEGKL